MEQLTLVGCSIPEALMRLLPGAPVQCGAAAAAVLIRLHDDQRAQAGSARLPLHHHISRHPVRGAW